MDTMCGSGLVSRHFSAIQGLTEVIPNKQETHHCAPVRVSTLAECKLGVARDNEGAEFQASR